MSLITANIPRDSKSTVLRNYVFHIKSQLAPASLNSLRRQPPALSRSHSLTLRCHSLARSHALPITRGGHSAPCQRHQLTTNSQRIHSLTACVSGSGPLGASGTRPCLVSVSVSVFVSVFVSCVLRPASVHALQGLSSIDRSIERAVLCCAVLCCVVLCCVVLCCALLCCRRRCRPHCWCWLAVAVCCVVSMSCLSGDFCCTTCLYGTALMSDVELFLRPRQNPRTFERLPCLVG